jgi:methylmalonyl-CoA/ethylmalonyl-CoA epimerase
MWVDDLDQAGDDVTAAGGSYLTGREDRNPNTFYEVKYRDPDGIVFDMTPNGRRGAVKEVNSCRHSEQRSRRVAPTALCHPHGTGRRSGRIRSTG